MNAGPRTRAYFANLLNRAALMIDNEKTSTMESNIHYSELLLILVDISQCSEQVTTVVSKQLLWRVNLTENYVT